MKIKSWLYLTLETNEMATPFSINISILARTS
jgi:hypothetical protein